MRTIRYRVSWTDTRTGENKTLTVQSMRSAHDIIKTLETVRPQDARDITLSYLDMCRFSLLDFRR